MPNSFNTFLKTVREQSQENKSPVQVILSVLKDKGPLTVSALVLKSGLGAQRLIEEIDRMQDLGLLKRKSENESVVELTPDGQDMANQVGA